MNKREYNSSLIIRYVCLDFKDNFLHFDYERTPILRFFLGFLGIDNLNCRFSQLYYCLVASFRSLEPWSREKLAIDDLEDQGSTTIIENHVLTTIG